MSELPGSRMDGRDLLSEAVAGLFARPGRTALTVLGTVLGVGALVATLGVASTAGNQIVTHFDELAATEVVVEPQQSGDGQPTAGLPWDSEDRITRLNGVRAAGTQAVVDVEGAKVTSVPVHDPTGRHEFSAPIVATSPGMLDAVIGTLMTGRYFDAGHAVRGDRVAVLGPGIAERLQIDRVSQQPAIYVGDELLTVIGILDDVERQAQLLNAVLIPDGTGARLFGLEAPTSLHIDTELGAAQLIGSQAPVALSPNNPDRLRVSSPPEPADVRRAVETDVNALFIVLGGVSLLVGAIGIANVTLVSVLERVGEIGLRRSLGATRRHIANQFLLESTAMGFVGGVLGASGGLLVVVAVSAARVWTPVVDVWVPLGAPVLGAVVGLLAGLYPALRAARLEPVDALRAAA